MARLAAVEETLDKIAMLRLADQAGRLLTTDSSIELAKHAGVAMAKLAGPATVLGRLATKAPMAAKLTGKMTGSATAMRGLLGTAPTMAPGVLKPAATGMGDVAQRMIKSPAPLGSVTPKVTGSQTAVGRLVGNTPTGVAMKPVGVTDPGRMAARITPGPAAAAPAGGTKPPGAGATGEQVGKSTVGVGKGGKPASAGAVHPEMKAGRDAYRASPEQQALVRSNLQARGVPAEEISKYHGAMMAEGYAPVTVPKGGPYGTPQPTPKAPADATPRSPMGKAPLNYPQAGQVYQQAGKELAVQPGETAGRLQRAVAAAAAPPPSQQAQVMQGLEAKHGPAVAPQAPAKAPGALTQYQQQLGVTGGYAKPSELQLASQKGVGKVTQGPAAPAQPASGAYAGPEKPREFTFGGRQPAKGGTAAGGAAGGPGEAVSEAGGAAAKGSGWKGKALLYGGLGLGAYGLMKGVPWAARQLEAGGGGSMAYGGGWSPVPYGYGSTPYGAGAGMAAV